MPSYNWKPTNFDDFQQRRGVAGMNVGMLACRLMRKGYAYAVTYAAQHAESARIIGFDDSNTPCVIE
jgi:hypothetical protein